MFLLSIAAYGCRFAIDNPQAWTVALSGLALGCLPFASLQSALLAFALFLAGVGLITWRDLTAPDRAWRLLWLFGATIVVPVVILSAVIASGAFHDFFVSYVEFPAFYIQANCCHWAGPAFFFSDPFFRAVIESSLALLIISAAGIVFLGRKESRRPMMWLPTLVAVALVPISIYSIEAPQTPSEHYLFLLLWPLCAASAFAFGALLTEISSDQRLKRASALILLQGALVACGPSIALNFSQPNEYLGRFAENVAHVPDAATAMVLRHVKPGDRMALWGLTPRFFSSRPKRCSGRGTPFRSFRSIRASSRRTTGGATSQTWSSIARDFCSTRLPRGTRPFRPSARCSFPSTSWSARSRVPGFTSASRKLR